MIFQIAQIKEIWKDQDVDDRINIPKIGRVQHPELELKLSGRRRRRRRRRRIIIEKLLDYLFVVYCNTPLSSHFTGLHSASTKF
jgi:hypothetical protein